MSVCSHMVGQSECGETGILSGLKTHPRYKGMPVRPRPLAPNSPGDGIGIHAGLRSRILRVRVSPGAPSYFARFVYRLGRCPFKAERRVRLSYRVPVKGAFI